MSEEPRAYTTEEVRELFLKQVRESAHYWASLPGKTPQERCDGLAFTILNIIDGSTLPLPAFDLIPSPHPTDYQYHREHGENWFEQEVINDCQLHEYYYPRSE